MIQSYYQKNEENVSSPCAQMQHMRGMDQQEQHSFLRSNQHLNTFTASSSRRHSQDPFSPDELEHPPVPKSSRYSRRRAMKSSSFFDALTILSEGIDVKFQDDSTGKVSLVSFDVLIESSKEDSILNSMTSKVDY